MAREPFDGRLPRRLEPEAPAEPAPGQGRGRWVAIDLLADEVARWRTLDPDLDLQVEDARALPFGDASFDAIACVSVIEHVPGEGDAAAMAEMWRVLRPGGVLHLTTNVRRAPGRCAPREPVYATGDAPEAPPGGAGAFLRAPLLGGDAATRLLAPAVGGGGARVRPGAAPRARAVLRRAAVVVPRRRPAAAGLRAQLRTHRGPVGASRRDVRCGLSAPAEAAIAAPGGPAEPPGRARRAVRQYDRGVTTRPTRPESDPLRVERTDGRGTVRRDARFLPLLAGPAGTATCAAACRWRCWSRST